MLWEGTILIHPKRQNGSVQWYFCCIIPTQGFLTFPVKSVGNLSQYGLTHRLLFFSSLFTVAIASPSLQMIPVTSTEERYQKCTISEENRHHIFRHSCTDHQYSAGVLQFQWKNDFYLQALLEWKFQYWSFIYMCKRRGQCRVLLTLAQLGVLTQNVHLTASLCKTTFNKLHKGIKPAHAFLMWNIACF